MQDLFIVIFFIAAFVLFFIQVSKIFTIEDIIAHYIAARGGKEQIDSIDSIQMKGVKHMNGAAITIMIIKEKERLFHAVYRLGSNNTGVIVTPESGWKFSSEEYELTKMDLKQWGNLQIEMDIFGPLVHHKKKGYKLFYEGKEWVSEKLCFRIRLKSNDGNAGFYFIDTKTNLLLQSRTQSAPAQSGLSGSYEIVHQFLDYQDFGGILFPAVIINESIRESFSIHFKEIDLNIDVDEKWYGPGS